MAVESEDADRSACATGSQRRVRSSRSTDAVVAQAGRSGWVSRPARRSGAAAVTNEPSQRESTGGNPFRRWRSCSRPRPGITIPIPMSPKRGMSRVTTRTRRAAPARPRSPRSGGPPTPPLRRSEELRLDDVRTRAPVPPVGRWAAARIAPERSPAPLRMCRCVRLPSHATGASPRDSVDKRTSRTVAATGPPPSECAGSSRRARSGRGCPDARHRNRPGPADRATLARASTAGLLSIVRPAGRSHCRTTSPDGALGTG